MSLNIKNREADELVEALARLTGESKTQAAGTALRERSECETRRRNLSKATQELLEIGRRCAAHQRLDHTEHGDFLYDEDGLPR